MSYFERNDLAISVHGTAALLEAGEAEFDVLGRLQIQTGGQSPLAWGDGAFLRIVAEKFFTSARDLERFVQV